MHFIPTSEELNPDKDAMQNKLGGVVRHRHLHLYFQEYNKESQRYGVNSRLRFCFPSSLTAAAPSQTPEDSVSEAQESEQDAFKSIELILLEMYFLLKSSFSRTNTQPYKLPVGAKISGLGALRVNQGKLFSLHLKSDKAIERGLWPILNPPCSLLTAYHRLCFCL